MNKQRLINTFKKLVQIDSPSLKEGKIVDYLQKELTAIGLKPRAAGRPNGGEAKNLIVELPGKGPRVLLNAHIDTVTHKGQIQPVEKKGYIVSVGKTILGADDKAGVAAILEILRSIKENKLAHPNLRIIFTVAEEIGLVGVKTLPKSLLKADFGIVLDGGDLFAVVNKAPSQVNLTAAIIGKAAHAGIHPEQGINAIKVASEAIAKMKIGRINKETTANIGVIEGGKATNIIPDRVEIKGEARSHNPRALKKQVKHMEKILRQACARHKAKLELKVKTVYNSFEIKKLARVVKLAVAALEKSGVKPVVRQTGGGSDANIFNAAGTPTIIMGLGADHVHTDAERLKIKDLVKGTAVVLALLKSITVTPQ